LKGDQYQRILVKLTNLKTLINEVSSVVGGKRRGGIRREVHIDPESFGLILRTVGIKKIGGRKGGKTVGASGHLQNQTEKRVKARERRVRQTKGGKWSDSSGQKRQTRMGLIPQKLDGKKDCRGI